MTVRILRGLANSRWGGGAVYWCLHKIYRRALRMNCYLQLRPDPPTKSDGDDVVWYLINWQLQTSASAQRSQSSASRFPSPTNFQSINQRAWNRRRHERETRLSSEVNLYPKQRTIDDQQRSSANKHDLW